MIDFKALMNRTPEECAAARERQNAEFLERMQATIQHRSDAVIKVLKARDRLSPEATQFADSLSRMARERDPLSGLIGARLADLTARQVSFLESLVEKVSSPVAREPEPGSRAARFRSRGG